ncbi:hypothetical protein [Agromyces humi]|uniref:hypothetical protein n=1 Tax=Agromyces humi TaxID=1766800 RepID=UPI00135CD4AA|nr:hypothetical protein [Agromyces humi]
MSHPVTALSIASILGPDREPDNNRIRLTAAPESTPNRFHRPTDVMINIRPAERRARAWYRVFEDNEGDHVIILAGSPMPLDTYLVEHLQPWLNGERAAS